MKIKTLAPAFGAIMFAGMASAAAASVVPAAMETFDLTVNGCGTHTSCLASGVESLGTVTVTDNSGALDFSVTLDGAELLGPDALSFSISGTDVRDVKIGSLTSGFSSDAHGDVALPFGIFAESINFTQKLGKGQTPPTSFSFVVTDRGENLTLSDLVSNISNVYYPAPFDFSDKENIYLASDVIANNHIGNVGALEGTSSPPAPGVPEPAAWAMMLLGMGAVGGSLRLHRQGAPSPAKA